MLRNKQSDLEKAMKYLVVFLSPQQTEILSYASKAQQP